MELTYRELLSSDTPLVLALHKLAKVEGHHAFTDNHLKKVKEFVSSEGLVVCAVLKEACHEPEQVVGAAVGRILDPFKGIELFSVVTRADCRRQGIATQLVLTLMAAGAAKSSARPGANVAVTTWVPPNNLPFKAFVQCMGFVHGDYSYSVSPNYMPPDSSAWLLVSPSSSPYQQAHMSSPTKELCQLGGIIYEPLVSVIRVMQPTDISMAVDLHKCATCNGKHVFGQGSGFEGVVVRGALQHACMQHCNVW